jgi:hypothetical protein
MGHGSPRFAQKEEKEARHVYAGHLTPEPWLATFCSKTRKSFIQKIKKFLKLAS